MMSFETLSARAPLDEQWQHLLEAVAREHGLVSSGAPLAAAVSELSRIYNGLSVGDTRSKTSLAARLGFSFARDVEKGAWAMRELVPLERDEGAFRLLDIGAGLGAMTFGVALALARAGIKRSLEATWVDVDEGALRIGQSIAKRVRKIDDIEITVSAKTGEKQRRNARYDGVIAGQVLSEMDRGLGEEERALAHADWLEQTLSENVEEHGSLVIVEPALRDRTRHLHRVRDRLALRSGITIFAPCLHSAECPALKTKGDWCHEDRDVNLPNWLLPIAKAAGLRWEGLTFSYLILRRDGRSLRNELGNAHGLVRVVSGPIVTKGKRELMLCGEVARGEEKVAGHARGSLLDRETTGRSVWDAAVRGDILQIDPPVPEGTSRVRPETTKITKIS